MRLFLICLVFVFGSVAKAQQIQDTPLQIVELYVSPDSFPDKLKYFCCEMYQEWFAPKTLGQQLGPQVKRECRLLYQDTGRAVVSVWLHDSITSMDIYVYLQYRKNWTIYAIRSLAMKADAEKELRRLDSIPESDRGKKYKESSGHSWEFDRDNLSLWMASDTVLASYFREHKTDFEKLDRRIRKRYKVSSSDSTLADVMKDRKVASWSEKLLLRRIYIDKNAPGTILYHIGGMLDNSVGFFYQPDAAKLPAISAGYFIVIKPLGNGWYLYKTT